MQNYSTVASRNLIMAERAMLKHAEPIKVLSTFGSQKEMPQNKTDTLVFRRALPLDYNATTYAPDVTAASYVLQEGTTPNAKTLSYQDVTVTLQNYGVLMKLSSKAAHLYEDDIPGDMVTAVGEHMGTLEELIALGVVKGGTNVIYANGSARTSVVSEITLNKLRQAARNIEAAHGTRITEKLAAGPNFGTTGIQPGYLVFIHTDLESDFRNLPGFTPVVEYGTQKTVHEREVGAVEQFRIISSPYFKSWQSGGGTIVSGTYLCNGANTGTTADVYPIMVVAKEAWGQVALKGMGAIDVTYLPPKQKSHANPLGMFGYVGAQFWKAAVRLNEVWMTRIEVACKVL